MFREKNKNLNYLLLHCINMHNRSGRGSPSTGSGWHWPDWMNITLPPSPFGEGTGVRCNDEIAAAQWSSFVTLCFFNVPRNNVQNDDSSHLKIFGVHLAMSWGITLPPSPFGEGTGVRSETRGDTGSGKQKSYLFICLLHQHAKSFMPQKKSSRPDKQHRHIGSLYFF